MNSKKKKRNKKKTRGKTISQAKNYLWRALREILDPSPTTKEVEQLLWTHFEQQCAYCRVSLSEGSAVLTLDHAISHQEGGGNHIGNMTLTCHSCNSLRRETPWRTFLEELVGSDEVEFESRCVRILSWLNKNYGQKEIEQKALDAFEESKARIDAVIIEEAERLRKMRS